MKTFLKIVSGSLIGFMIGIFLLVLIVMGIAGSAGKSKKVKVASNSILELNLSVKIPDQAVNNPFGGLSPMWGQVEPGMGLFELKEIIESTP